MTPDVDVKIMVNIDVAVAKCIGMFMARFIMGTMSTPPPMPSKPEDSPPKKLKLAPSMIVLWSLKSSLSDFAMVFGFCPLSVEVLRLKMPVLIMMRAAMKMRKNPKIRPRYLAGMIVVRNAPRRAPGTVVAARTSPVLAYMRRCLA